MASFDRPLPFHAQAAVDKTDTFAHQDSITKMWALRWRDRCSRAEYPFGEASVADFDPIFASLAADFGDDAGALVRDPDGYAARFLPGGAALARRAEQAEQGQKIAEARDLFLRAAAVYRIARFPVNRSPLGHEAWALGGAAYLRGGAYLDPPVRETTPKSPPWPTCGYHALRLAHAHADRLLAVVCHGGACHYMFDPGWVAAQDHMEYPFGLAGALAWKFGFRRASDLDKAREEADVEAYAREAKGTFSLEGGRAGGSCRLLIVNGLEDSVFPIEDSWLVASRGRPKEVRLLEDRRHMGNPGRDEITVEWASEVVKQADGRS
ncbi:Cut9-interacting protein scn1 [Pestalotiopsis sp. IQ-011]